MALSKSGAPQPWTFFDPLELGKYLNLDDKYYIRYIIIYTYIVYIWMISIDTLPTEHCQRLSNKICEHHIDTSVGPRRISRGRFEDGRTIERVRRQVMKGPGDLVILRESSTQCVWCGSSIFAPASYHSWKSIQLKNFERSFKQEAFWILSRRLKLKLIQRRGLASDCWLRTARASWPAVQRCRAIESRRLISRIFIDASVLSLYAWQPG